LLAIPLIAPLGASAVAILPAAPAATPSAAPAPALARPATGITADDAAPAVFPSDIEAAPLSRLPASEGSINDIAPKSTEPASTAR